MKSARYTLGLLLLIYVVNHIDRQVMYILIEPVKGDLGISDTQVGWLVGGAFALFYTVAGFPIARLADSGNRSNIIAISLLVWSAFTVACGLTRNFGQLMAARVGVGVGEAGCTPPAHSMISDAFPPERRATALSVYQLGVPLGALFGLAFGGYLAEELGWRAAFFLVGAPGILLAGVAKLSLREPARGAFDAGGDVEIEPLGDTLRFMAGLPAMRHVVVGSAVQTLFLAGLAAFHGSFLIRVHGLSLTEAGLKLGLINGIAGGFAVLGAGWLADRVGQSDLRWQFWIPAAGALVSIPFSVIAYQTESVDLAIASIAAATIFNNTYSGLTHAIMQRLVKPRMRAMMSAIALFAMNIVGFGLGPIAVGFLSDRFGGGSEIRYALLSLVICMAWAAVHYLIGARSYLRDLEAKNA